MERAVVLTIVRCVGGEGVEGAVVLTIVRCVGGEGVEGAVVKVIITDQSLEPTTLKACITIQLSE